MKRRPALCALAALVVLGACGSGGDGDGAASELVEAVKDAGDDGAVVRLAAVVEGRWKRFYAFPPFAVPEAVEDALGFPWEGARGDDGGPRVDDKDDSLLVFTRGKRVVADMVVSRCAAEFGAVPGVTEGIPRRRARFVIDYRTNGDACAVLRLAPTR